MEWREEREEWRSVEEKGQRENYWLKSRSRGKRGETAREARAKGGAIGVYPGGGEGARRSEML